jgi:hypothetical protein
MALPDTNQAPDPRQLGEGKRYLHAAGQATTAHAPNQQHGSPSSPDASEGKPNMVERHRRHRSLGITVSSTGINVV